MKTTMVPFLCWMLFSAVAIAEEPGELAEFRAAIKEKYAIKESAFGSANAQPIIEQFYSDEVIATDNEGKTLYGRAGIRPMYEGLVQDFTVRVDSVHSHVNGDAGWDWANFHVTPKDPEAEGFSFKILFLWERIDGEWWCKGDMYVPGAFDDADGTDTAASRNE